MKDDEIEAVASAFFAVEYSARDWDRAPEFIKEQFRIDARAAIAECMRDEVDTDTFTEQYDRYWPNHAGRGSEGKIYLH